MKEINNFRLLYWQRFKNKRNQKIFVWGVLCRNFFQKFIAEDDCLLEIGAGYCEFINNIRCAKKYAIDINEEIVSYAGKDVTAIVADGSDLGIFPSGYFDRVFMSNFLEHLSSKKELLKVIEEVYRVTKKNGSVLIMSPNILYTKEHYWDFLDHNIPLNHYTIKELLKLFDFKIKILFPKFLPYSTISRFPLNSILIKIYLKIPLLWRFLGKQMFIVAQK